MNLTSLARKFDPAGYLSPTSDIVALMTLEHQTRMSDLLIRASWEARVLDHEGKTDEPARTRLDRDEETLVAYMLFADEAPIDSPVRGVSTFTKSFPERGPRDRQGRSLREFDLQTRLFKYPLSYMVYSDAFDNLPDQVRERIYRRLFDVLTGRDQDPKYKRLSAEDRRAILEIFRDTKAGLPAYWTTN